MTTEQTPKPQFNVEEFLADIKKASEKRNKDAMFKLVTDVAGIENTEKALKKPLYSTLPLTMMFNSARSETDMKNVYGCGQNNVMSKDRVDKQFIAQHAVTIALYEYHKAGFGGWGEFLADMTEHIKTEKIKTEKMNQLAQIRRHAQCARS